MLKRTLLLTALLLATTATAAHADTVTYTLSTAQWNNDASCAKCGPTYGTITVDYSSATEATVTVDLNDAGRTIFFNQGGPAEDGDALEFNLPVGAGNASDFTITPLTSGFEADYPPAASTLYGGFSYGVTCDYTGGACKSASDTPVTSLQFTIQSNGSAPIDFTGTGTVLFSAGVTDQTATTDPTGDVAAATPEPSSLMLLGTSMLGAAGVLRRRWNR
jgi:hypothetical protein